MKTKETISLELDYLVIVILTLIKLQAYLELLILRRIKLLVYLPTPISLLQKDCYLTRKVNRVKEDYLITTKKKEKILICLAVVIIICLLMLNKVVFLAILKIQKMNQKAVAYSIFYHNLTTKLLIKVPIVKAFSLILEETLYLTIKVKKKRKNKQKIKIIN